MNAAGIIADLAIDCWDARDAHTYRMGRAQHWLRRRDSYADAAAAIPAHLADRKRADHCTNAAAWRVLAWTALADAIIADREERRELILKAWSARRNAARSWKMAGRRAMA